MLVSPARDFELVVPVLIAGAAVLLLVQPRVKSLSARPDGERHAGVRGGADRVGLAVKLGWTAYR